MPASPYDANEYAEGSKKSPLNGLSFNTTQEAGRVVEEGEVKRSTMNAGWPTAIQPGLRIAEDPKLSYLAFDDVLGYGTPMVPSGGLISGTVTDGASPLASVMVRVYYRKTGLLLFSVRTDAAGYFRYDGASPARPGGYFAVAFDLDGAPVLNAIIYDWLTPA